MIFIPFQIPSLIKKLPDEPFDSEGAVKNFLFSSSSCGQLDTDKSDRSLELRENRSSVKKMDDIVSDWLLSWQGDSSDRQGHVAAFLPWTETQGSSVGLEKTGASVPLLPKTGNSNLHSIAVDSNPALYRNIPDAKAKEHVPRVTTHNLDLETEIHCSMPACRPGEVISNQYSLEKMKGRGEQKTEEGAETEQQEPDYVTYLNFISQITSQSNKRQLLRDIENIDWTREPTEGL